MRNLVYCVFSAAPYEKMELPAGGGCRPVFVVSNGGLGAAVSRILHRRLARDVSELLDYQRVVEHFHRERTIIPMRYGSLFRGEPGVIEFLEDYRERFTTLLEKLDDCAEMGIRVILPAEESNVTDSDAERLLTDSTSEYCRDVGAGAGGPGQDFLARRKRLYAAGDRSTAEDERLEGRAHSFLAGMFVESKKESLRLPQGRLLSFYFLVPKRLVGSFRKAVCQMGTQDFPDHLLSGPWPPYSFV